MFDRWTEIIIDDSLETQCA